MRPIDKFILHVVHNLFPLNEYSEGELKKLMTQFRDEADDLNIQITDAQLKAYIQRFDALKNSPKVTDKDLRKYTLSKLIKLVTSSKGVKEPEDEVDVTPDIVYNENGLIIYNGSKENNCLTFGAGERWCITRGSFGNYRYDSNRKNPTFYLVKDTNLPDSDKKSFFVVVVGNDDTYKASDRTNNDVGGRQTEWDRWEGWSFVEQNFPSVSGLRSIFKYIPLSSSEKINQSYKNKAVTIREWVNFPFAVKEQYLVVRKGRDLFQDITNDEFVEKYLPKYPQIANTIATNAGVIDSVILAKHLDKFSNQDVKSIISNMRDKIDLKFLPTDAIPFEVKKFLVQSNKWDVPSADRLYVTKDGSTIVKLKLGDDISVSLYQAEDDYPSVKLNKRTSKYLLDYPDLDKIPVRNLIKLVQDEVIDKSVLDSVLEKAKTDSDSAIVVKDNIIIDSNSFASYKITGDKIEQVSFEDEEVQAVFGAQVENESFQQNALYLINDRGPIPETIDKDAFISILRATPLENRVIEYNGVPSVVLTTQSTDHPIVVQNDSRGFDSFQLTAWYGDNGNWRRKGGSGGYSDDPEVYRSVFSYLRQRGITCSERQLINNFSSVSRIYNPRGVVKAIIQADIPMDGNSRYKPVIYEDKPYIINTQNTRESYGVSDTTGKIVKANIASSLASRMLGNAAPAAATATGRRGRPAGQPNTPQAPATPAAAGDINVQEVMDEIGLLTAFLRLPRSILRRLNVTNASRVAPNGDRGAARRNNQLGNRGTVGRVLAIGSSKIYIIRLASGQIIASINVQPGNSNYVLTGNADGNVAISLNSPSELVSALTNRGLAEHRSYIMREYLNENPKHAQEVRDMVAKHIDEISAKKAIATGALALGLLGTPSLTQAQNTIKDKVKAGITAIQNKFKPQQKVDTIKIQKDAPLVLAKFKNDQSVGYGVARSKSESSVRQMAYFNASADLMKKLGKTQMTAGMEIVDEKMYQLPDGTYEAETVVKINQ